MFNPVCYITVLLQHIIPRMSKRFHIYCEQNLKLHNVQYTNLFSPSDQITEDTKTVTYKKVLDDCRGTRELYTPSPLLYCREELHEILAKRLHGWWGRKTRRNQQTWKILQFAFSVTLILTKQWYLYCLTIVKVEKVNELFSPC